MEGIVVIAIIWFVIGRFIKGMKSAAPPGSKGPHGRPPGGAGHDRAAAGPAGERGRAESARPGQASDWGHWVMMAGQPPLPPRETPPEAEPDMAGAPAAAPALEGYIPEGMSAWAASGAQPVGGEGASLPGESGQMAAGRRREPHGEAEPARTPMVRARPGPAALRDAVVWAEILGRPKALKRLGR
jgi:hypothetical protein